MSLRKGTRLVHSLAFRLTVMYAGICTASLVAVLLLSYLGLQAALQRQLDQGLLNEIEEYRALLETQDLGVLQDVLDREVGSEGTDQVFYRIVDADGNEVLATEMSSWSDVVVDRSRLDAALAGGVVFETCRREGRVHAARVVYGPVGAGLALQVGESTTANGRVLAYFREVSVGTTLVFVFCSLFLGWIMARRALGGVRGIAQVARDITGGAWDRRVPVGGRCDELDELALAFNEMLEQIQVLIRELGEVTDDIAHDLRTPIARIRARAELVLTREGSDEDHREKAGGIIEECGRLLELINTTLEISQVEAGTWSFAREPVDMADLVEDVCDLFQPAAEDKGLELVFQSAAREKGLDLDSSGRLTVKGDIKKLRRAVAHIIDNAIKFTGSGGGVSVACGARDRLVVVRIEDSGIGIPAGQLEKIFSRFYQVDQSRSEGGNGLGLSLSRAICRAHGGDVVAASAPGGGSAFELRLPLLAPKE